MDSAPHCSEIHQVSIAIGVPQNGWLIRESPNLKWMIHGGTPISGKLHILHPAPSQPILHMEVSWNINTPNLCFSPTQILGWVWGTPMTKRKPPYPSIWQWSWSNDQTSFINSALTISIQTPSMAQSYPQSLTNCILPSILMVYSGNSLSYQNGWLGVPQTIAFPITTQNSEVLFPC